MVKRRQRDIYGNWVWTDDEEPVSSDKDKNSDSAKSLRYGSSKTDDDEEQVHLDWRDYIALTVASLETFLLPLVVFILILVGIVIALALTR